MPPVAVTVAVPLDWPLHGTLLVVVEAVRSLGSVIVIDVVVIQAFASVIVTTQVPVLRLFAVDCVLPLHHE